MVVSAGENRIFSCDLSLVKADLSRFSSSFFSLVEFQMKSAPESLQKYVEGKNILHETLKNMQML